MNHKFNINLLVLFFYFSSGVLFLTGIAKLISATGAARALVATDPVLGIGYRQLFLLAGSIEIIAALAILYLRQRVRLQAALTAWISTTILAYRFLFWLAGYEAPCSCMGTLTDALQIDPFLIDAMMKSLLALLLIGSYFTVIYFHILKQSTRH